MENYDAESYHNHMSDFWNNKANMLTNSLLCFCTISHVDPKRRTCTIHTFGSDERVRAGAYDNITIMSPYSSALGEEFTAIPKPGSLGICAFLDGRPYILGFIPPLTSSTEDSTIDADDEREVVEGGASAGKGKEELQVGDFLIRTETGSKIAVRSGGSIQLESTPICKRDYIPLNNVIRDTSGNYEFSCDAGAESWSRLEYDGDLVKTNRLWRSDIDANFVIQDERGTVEKGKPWLWRQRIGAGTSVSEGSGLIIEKLLTYTGTYTFTLKDTAVNKTVYSNGRTVFGINDYSFYQEIRPNGTLYMNVANNASFTMGDDGQVVIKSGIAAPKEEGPPTDGEGTSEIILNPEGNIYIRVGGDSAITISEKGVTASVGVNSILHLSSDGKAKLETKGAIEVKSPGIALSGKKVDLGEVVQDTVPMGQMLVEAINQAIEALNSHTHQIPGGGSFPGSVSSAPLSKAPTVVAGTVLSQTVQVQK